jgi:hypothetical protein
VIDRSKRSASHFARSAAAKVLHQSARLHHCVAFNRC